MENTLRLCGSKQLLLIIPLLLVVTWLAARGLDSDAIWIDEYWSVYNAGGAHYGPLSPGEIFQRIATEDIWHVPLYYLLIAGWGSVAGWSAFALRAFSLLFGVLSVAMIYRVGRDFHSPLAGLAAAVTLGFSAYYLYYFHEMRSYTINLLLAMLAVWSYWHLIFKPSTHSRRYLGVLFLTTLAILYTHYLATIVLMALGVYHLLFARKNRLWWQITGVVVLAGILFVPWLSVTLRAWREASAPDNVALRDWGPTPLELNALLIFAFGNGSLVLPLILGWFSFRELTPPPNPLPAGREGELASRILRAKRSSTPMLKGIALDQTLPDSPPPSTGEAGRGSRFLWSILICWLVLALIFNLLISLFVVMRYLLPLWPVLALIMGVGTAALARRGISPVLILGVWMIGGIWSSLRPEFMNQFLDTRLLSPPWHTITRELRDRVQPEDVAALLLPDEMWYVWQEWPSGFHFHELGIQTVLVESYPHLTDRQYRDGAQQLTAPRVWIGYDPADQPTSWWRYTTVLENQGYALCDAPVTVPDYRLDIYSRTPENPALQFGGETGVMPVGEIEANQPVILGWSLGETIIPQNYSVALHFDDASGTMVKQIDYGLPTGRYTCVASLLPELAPGTYTVYAMVYDWQTQERLTVEGTGDNRFKLGEVFVR